MNNHLQIIVEKIFVTIKRGVIYCPVCGKLSIIKVKSANLREDGTCLRCRSNSRKRHLAIELLNLIQNNAFASLKAIPNSLDISIYNVESNGALHHYLKHLNKYACSEYFGPYKEIGYKKDDVLNIDLMDIPFEDNRFDFTLSTEVLEHVPDPYKAFKEIHRILKKGGSHIFTVPFYVGREKDEVRAHLNEKNEIVHLLEPQYHGDPIRGREGILVFTIFSNQMVEKLKEIGFDTLINHRRNTKLGILGENNIVFIATKV